jgi:hypothetical protein
LLFLSRTHLIDLPDFARRPLAPLAVTLRERNYPEGHHNPDHEHDELIQSSDFAVEQYAGERRRHGLSPGCPLGGRGGKDVRARPIAFGYFVLRLRAMARPRH